MSREVTLQALGFPSSSNGILHLSTIPSALVPWFSSSNFDITDPSPFYDERTEVKLAFEIRPKLLLQSANYLGNLTIPKYRLIFTKARFNCLPSAVLDGRYNGIPYEKRFFSLQ